MNVYNFGILGLGMIAEFHAKAIDAMENGKLTHCCSRSMDKAKTFAKEYGCKPFDSLDEMLTDPELDIITICTPSGSHAESVIAAAEAGKHVICEKPIDVTLERIDRMIAAHEKAGTSLCGIFPSRFYDVAQLVKKTVDSGRFGKLVYGGAYVPWWRDQKYYDEGGWKGTQKYDGGGALMNQSIHAIDSLIWMMGDVESVSAYKDTLAHENIEVEDTAAASLRFKNGALGVIMGTTSIYPGDFKRLEICGNKGTAVLVEADLAQWNFADEDEKDEEIRKKYAAVTDTGGGASDPAAISFENHKRNFQACVEAIEKGENVPIDGPESRRAVEVILAIYKSAEEGRPVMLQ